VDLLEGLGGTLEWKTVASTFDPNSGQFVPHSWLVLDEVDLFDFLADKVVDRTPATFRALLDESGPVAWLDVTQRLTGNFTVLDGSALAGDGEAEDPSLSMTGLDNCMRLDVDLSRTPVVGPGPVDVIADSADGGALQLLLAEAECPPEYLVDTVLGTLVPDTDYDPFTAVLTVDIPLHGSLDASAVCEPAWTGLLSTVPKTLLPGDALDLVIDAPEDTTTAWMFAGFFPGLAKLKGYSLTVQLGGLTLIFPLPLDAAGDLLLSGHLPNDPALSGIDLLLQFVGVDAGGQIVTVSNMWIIEVE
jgi:hypothetical protein